MAASLMTPSRNFGNSVSNAQAPYSSIVPSMADTLPTVDFAFNDLRERMAQFTVRFDEFIERGRKRVLEERNTFRMNLAEVSDTQRNRKQAILNLESRSNNHASTLAKEAVETEEMHAAIRSLTAQKEAHILRRDELKDQIEVIQAQVKTHKEAQAAHHKSLDAQARLNGPELSFWEDGLGLKLDGTGVEDQLRFTFVGLDERFLEREHCFELHIGGSEYEIVTTKPRLDKESLEATQRQLNEIGDLGAFMKSMRQLFIKQLRG